MKISCRAWAIAIGFGICGAQAAANTADSDAARSLETPIALRDELNELARHFDPDNQAGNALWRRASAVFRQLDERRSLLPSDVRSYLNLALRTWRFEDVAALKKSPKWGHMVQVKKLPSHIVPAQNTGQSASLWDIDFDAAKLTEKSFPIEPKAHLLIAFHPHCNPCHRAATDISRDSALLQQLEGKTTWAASVDSGFDLVDFEKWQQRFPSAPPKLVKDWTAFGVSPPFGTPFFHVVVCGRVQQVIVGWPPEGNKAALLSALKAAEAITVCR